MLGTETYKTHSIPQTPFCVGNNLIIVVQCNNSLSIIGFFLGSQRGHPTWSRRQFSIKKYAPKGLTLEIVKK